MIVYFSNLPSSRNNPCKGNKKILKINYIVKRKFLILEIHTLYTVAYTRHHFVWNGV